MGWFSHKMSRKYMKIPLFAGVNAVISISVAFLAIFAAVF